jgi:hypothetical protein
VLKTGVWIGRLGLLFAHAFVMCVARELVVPLSSPTRRRFAIFLPGFKWLTLGRLLVGRAESFLWGVYAALVPVPIANVFLLNDWVEHPLSSGLVHRRGLKAVA